MWQRVYQEASGIVYTEAGHGPAVGEREKYHKWEKGGGKWTKKGAEDQENVWPKWQVYIGKGSFWKRRAAQPLDSWGLG